MGLERNVLEGLIFNLEGARRHTQDSPVLPDVWIQFGLAPGTVVDLIITPEREVGAGVLSRVLRDRLNADRGQRTAASIDVAYTQGNVAVSLDLGELVRVVLPLTPWWQTDLWNGEDPGGLVAGEASAARRASLRRALARFLEERPGTAHREGEGGLRVELLWLVRLVGHLEIARVAAARRPASPASPTAAELVAAFVDVVRDVVSPLPDQRGSAWLVNRNRRAAVAMHRSTQAIKADAARRLFEIRCNDLAWAVIDSGIDASHPAFLRSVVDPETREPLPWWKRTRVVETYDFTRIRALLCPDAHGKLARHGRITKAQRELLKDLKRYLMLGREVDWGLLAPLLRVPHDADYQPPRHEHGTHVAGILAADWPNARAEDSASLTGVCPDLRLYDLRVLDEKGEGREFTVIAALQFVRYLNSQRDQMAVHGANLSLSIPHDVVNFACGRTPVCDECERLVAAGTVTVVAAGNQGYDQVSTPGGGVREGYQTISITDPGNADGVITVGATHRYRPHTYGVSYFSSRGPTGDGRLKPDLVAPGEKILAPVPRGEHRRLDGTSMAAPHVSGAAALLMARHRELVGEPQRVKQILCDTATDLGRERYFQGAGMLDVLRAIQSI